MLLCFISARFLPGIRRSARLLACLPFARRCARPGPGLHGLRAALLRLPSRLPPPSRPSGAEPITRRRPSMICLLPQQLSSVLQAAALPLGPGAGVSPYWHPTLPAEQQQPHPSHPDQQLWQSPTSSSASSCPSSSPASPPSSSGCRAIRTPKQRRASSRLDRAGTAVGSTACCTRAAVRAWLASWA